MVQPWPWTWSTVSSRCIFVRSLLPPRGNSVENVYNFLAYKNRHSLKFEFSEHCSPNFHRPCVWIPRTTLLKSTCTLHESRQPWTKRVLRTVIAILLNSINVMSYLLSNVRVQETYSWQSCFDKSNHGVVLFLGLLHVDSQVQLLENSAANEPGQVGVHSSWSYQHSQHPSHRHTSFVGLFEWTSRGEHVSMRGTR